MRQDHIGKTFERFTAQLQESARGLEALLAQAQTESEKGKPGTASAKNAEKYAWRKEKKAQAASKANESDGEYKG